MGEWMCRSTYLDLGTSWGVSDELHAAAALAVRKEPPVPIG
jgi:hypothetical protein